jgi:hypothetical protein
MMFVLEGLQEQRRVGRGTDGPRKFERSLREIEAAAAEIVKVGDLLFRGGEPSDPELLRRYRH